MKKILCVLLLFSILFSVCACGASNNSANNSESTTENSINPKTTRYYLGNISLAIPSAWGKPVEDTNLYYFYPEGRDNDVTQSMLMVSKQEGDFSDTITQEAAKEIFNSYDEGLEESGMHIKQKKTVDTSITIYPAEYITGYQPIDDNTYTFEAYTILYNSDFYSIGTLTIKGNKNNYSNQLKQIVESITYDYSTDELESEYENTESESDSDDGLSEVTTEATTKAKKKATAKAKKKKSYKKENWNPEITYDQLARTPDDYTGKNITFAGKVLQVMEDSSSNQTQLRIATSDDYDKVMLIGYDSSILKSRVLEDDEIRFYGTSIGLITYQSTMGGNITIPAAIVEHIDIQ